MIWKVFEFILIHINDLENCGMAHDPQRIIYKHKEYVFSAKLFGKRKIG
jgi:hypothetical protein